MPNNTNMFKHVLHNLCSVCQKGYMIKANSKDESNSNYSLDFPTDYSHM